MIVVPKSKDTCITTYVCICHFFGGLSFKETALSRESEHFDFYMTVKWKLEMQMIHLQCALNRAWVSTGALNEGCAAILPT